MKERTASLAVYLPLNMHALWRRRAQQKCRERQKQKLKISEVRSQELQRALEQLRLQNLALEARNELLQRMVGLQEASRQPPPQPQPGPKTEAVPCQVQCATLQMTPHNLGHSAVQQAFSS